MNNRKAKAIRKAVKAQCQESGVPHTTVYTHDEVEIAPTPRNLSHPLTVKVGMGLKRLIRRVDINCQRGIYLSTKRAIKNGDAVIEG